MSFVYSNSQLGLRLQIKTYRLDFYGSSKAALVIIFLGSNLRTLRKKKNNLWNAGNHGDRLGMARRAGHTHCDHYEFSRRPVCSMIELQILYELRNGELIGASLPLHETSSGYSLQQYRNPHQLGHVVGTLRTFRCAPGPLLKEKGL